MHKTTAARTSRISRVLSQEGPGRFMRHEAQGPSVSDRVQGYIHAVNDGKMPLDYVPEQYRAHVERRTQ